MTFSPWEQPPSPLPVVELEAASAPSARPLSFGENVGNRIPKNELKLRIASPPSPEWLAV